MPRRDERPHVGCFVARVPDPPLLNGRLEQFEEAVVDAALHEQPAACTAVLSGVVEHRPRHGRCRLLEISVFEHDVRRLAAELERDGLERPRAAGGDVDSDLGGSGEDDLANVRMRDEALPDDGTGARDDLEEPVGKTRLPRELTQPDRRERCEFSGLEDHGIACCKGGREGPGRDRHRDEHRHLPPLSGVEQRKLPGVAISARRVGRRMPFVTVQLRLHIGAAGEDEPVQPGDRSIRRGLVLRRQQHRDAAGRRDTRQVLCGKERRPHVPHPLLRAFQVGRDADQRPDRVLRAVRNHGCAPSL